MGGKIFVKFSPDFTTNKFYLLSVGLPSGTLDTPKHSSTYLGSFKSLIS